jgi:hypothetical protein
VKSWIRKDENGQRDPIDVFKSGRLLSGIAEAISSFLSEEHFSPTKYIVAQLPMSDQLVKKTLVDVLGMKMSVDSGFFMC